MRSMFSAAFVAAGLIAAASVTHATPTMSMQAAQSALPADHGVVLKPGIVEIAGGCGPGWHPERYVNRWGHWRVRCVPNRRRW